MRYIIALKVDDNIPPLWEGFPPTRLFDDAHYPYCFGEHRDYHCPQCGSIWAMWRKEVEPGEELSIGVDDYHPYRRSCPNHVFGAWAGDIPGSMILRDHDILLLPAVLLKRELLLRTIDPSQLGDSIE